MQSFAELALLTAVLACYIPVGDAFSFGPAMRNSMRLDLSMMAKRLPIIAGNWKMNTDLNSGLSLITELSELTKDVNPEEVEIAVVPPFPFLAAVQQVAAASSQKIKVGAQACSFEEKGAYTGAVSTDMLKSVGCSYVLVGHSERRSIFGETDEELNKIMKKVLDSGITPILCIGELKEEYELGITNEICTAQLAKDLSGLSADAVKTIVIAYEPVWAIGTGLTATPEIAQGVHSAIRQWLKKTYGEDVSEAVRIQYGGSVSPETVDELMKCPDIDGALVGGASLKADSFARIVKFQA